MYLTKHMYLSIDKSKLLFFSPNFQTDVFVSTFEFLHFQTFMRGVEFVNRSLSRCNQ